MYELSKQNNTKGKIELKFAKFNFTLNFIVHVYPSYISVNTGKKIKIS